MPHHRTLLWVRFFIMKKQFFLLLALAAVLSACNWGSTNEHSPSVTAGFFRLNPIVQADTIAFEGDTLRQRWDSKLGVLYMDTIALGDSVRFLTELYSYYNNLKRFEVQYDPAKLSVWIPVDTALQKGLLPASHPEEGILVFDPQYNLATFAVWYRPLVKGSIDLTLLVESDSSFPESEIGFQQRVR